MVSKVYSKTIESSLINIVVNANAIDRSKPKKK